MSEKSREYFQQLLEKNATKIKQLEAERKQIIVEEREWKRKIYAEQRAKEQSEIDQAKERIAKSYGIPLDGKFHKAWGIAWEQGHSSGLGEVENIFDDLVDLIR